ncbi:hypothetical protein DL96DRAFT_1615393 [Flagelloscypha sp. PMI_526]|nr:hypothetical protein DL96DRAFT_1615393 [Flagelloscypha sp. PMI_526]
MFVNSPTSSTGPITIPHELVDRILDFNHSSVPSLASSSLVCKDWLVTTRYHLFRIPVLYQVSLGRGPKDNTNAFIEVLNSPLCTFRSTIQGCVLNVERGGVRSRCLDALAAHQVHVDLLIISQYIGRLSFAELHISERFSSIRNLVYWNIGTWALDLPELVTSLPLLESLSVYTKLRDIDETPHFPITQGLDILPGLRTLRLRLFHPSKLLQWLLDLPGYHTQIETLDIVVYNAHPTGWGLVGALETFVAANSQTLYDLSLKMEYYSDLPHDLDDQIVHDLNLTTLIHLRSLTLRSHDIHAMCQTLTRLLQTNRVHLNVLTLYSDPLPSLNNQQYINDSFRETLSDTFEDNFFDKVDLLRLKFVSPLHFRIDLDEENMAKVTSLAHSLNLSSWKTREKVDIEVTKARNWQKHSIEMINRIIWGSRLVPFRFQNPSRIGTL